MRSSPLQSPKTIAPLLIALALLGTALAGCMDMAEQGELDEETTGETSGEPTEGSTGESSDATNGQEGTQSTGSTSTLASAPATGQLSVYIKDAPTDHFSEIWVNVTSVEVHLAPGSVNGTDDGDLDADDEEAGGQDNETTDSSGNETTENGGNETSDPDGNETTDSGGNETAENGDSSNASTTNGGWIVVVNESRSLDLLSFSEPDAKAFLGDAELTAGRYTQIRLHISDAWGIRAEDGGQEEIELANGVARIVRTFQVDPDNTTQIVIDVDLDRSVRSYGPPHAPHGWRMTPVIGKVLIAQDPEDAEEDIPDSE